MTTTAQQTAAARVAIQSILAGDSPNGATPEALGEYWTAYAALLDAHATGGTPAARTVWNTLCRATPDLATLIAGSPQQTPPMPEEPPWPTDDAKTSPRTTREPKRFAIQSAADALAPQPPIEWIVENLFSAGSVSILAGEPGSGKTWVMLDCAVAVASQERWLGRATAGSSILILDEESGPRRLKRRLGDVLRGHEAGADTPTYFTSLNQFDPKNDEDIAIVKEGIQETGAKLLIIDALADIIPGCDENSVQDVQPVFMALRKLAEETQVAIVILHHLNKQGGYRGSSAIKGAIDLLLVLETNGGVMNFKANKARDVEEELAKFAAKGNWIENTFSLSPVAAKTRVTFSKSESYVLRYLLAHGESRKNDIENHADVCSSGTAHNALYALADKGYCYRTNDGAQGNIAIYALSETGQEAARNL